MTDFKEKLFLFNILLCVLSVDWVSGLNPDCANYKQFNFDSFVCVCTEAKPCAQIVAPVKTAPGVVTRWFSSRDGARLRKSTLSFNKKGSKPVGYAGAKTGELSIKVNREVKYQEIFGFGGAFTDSTGYNMLRMSPKIQAQILTDYFSKDGLEYNVGRIPIGGSDFSLKAYSLDDIKEDKSLTKFNLTKEDFDYKIPFIQKAKSMATHEIRLFGSPWSAPAWMKTNNDPNHGGSIKGPIGSEYWQIYAKYYVHYLNAYKEHNITHWGITVQNEPYAIQPFVSMFYSPEMMRDFLAMTLGPELERSGYGSDKLKVMIWDHNLDHVQEWVKIVFADKTASKYAAGTAIHWYTHSPHDLLDKPHEWHPDKFILSTEACDGPGVKLGAWVLAERYAFDILGVLLHHTIGWTDWNMVLDTQGGPNYVSNYNDAPVLIDAAKHEYYRQPSFYAMAHFSKFLSPGSHRIDSTIVSQNNTTASVGAFRTPNNSTVVIVVNNDDIEVDFTLDDSKAGKVVTKIEPKSIQTYVYYD